MDRIEAVFQPLSPEHRRDEFDCGVTALNRYLQTTARQHEAKNIARTFVLVTHAEPTVVRGYYTLTLAELDVESIPSRYQRKLPRHPLPVARLGRLAVDRRFQAQGLGGLLLSPTGAAHNPGAWDRTGPAFRIPQRSSQATTDAALVIDYH